MNRKLFCAALVFLVSFSVYLFSSVPAITEDDSGELTAAGATLGTAHSPGYPVYCMLSKILVTAVPMGNTAYRVNLASSLTLAAASAVLFIACLEMTGGLAAALSASLIFAFSAAVWAMANVTEVYGVTSFIVCLMLLVMVRARTAGSAASARYFYAVMFLFGLAVSAHYTVGLLLPGIIWWALSNRGVLLGVRWKMTIPAGFFWAAAGFSTVIYLYVRANADPVVAWEDPKTLERFWQVIARLRYGTASLSQGGPPPLSPEILAGKIAFYFSSLNENFTLLGTLIFAVGALSFMKDKKLGWAFFIFIIGSGPGFVLLANAGIDATSRELMERFFFLSFIFAVAVMAGGLKLLPKYAAGLSLVLPVFLLWTNYPLLEHRQEYMYYDYGKDILKTVPRGSLLFSDRADEMEFALTYLHTAGGRRPDIKFIDCNAGATKSIYGSGYYRVWGKPRLEARQRVEKEMIAAWQGPVYYASFFPDMVKIPRVGEGLLYRAKPLAAKAAAFPCGDVYAFRVPDKPWNMNGRLNELVLSYYQLCGDYADSSGGAQSGREFFSGVEAFDDTGRWTANLGYLYHKNGMADDALRCYEKAVSMGAASAVIYTNLGAIYEQKGRTEDAVKSYEQASQMPGDSVQAHYNLAVLYWKEAQWDLVVKEFGRVLELDPGNVQAKHFLASAQEKQKSNFGSQKNRL